MLKNGGKEDVEIKYRIETAARIYQSIKNIFIDTKKISRKIKMSLYKTGYSPISNFVPEVYSDEKMRRYRN